MFGTRVQRLMTAMFCIAAILTMSVSGSAIAAGTGQISGTVVDAVTGKPLADAKIDARSPAESYTATSGANGSFSIAGVAVDTYTISVQRQGYAIFSLQGVTVSQDETFPVNAKLASSLRTIARVGSRARSITSAFQPDQTIDRTVVNAAGIDQLLGKSFVTDGKQLLSELPGVNIDKNGTVLIRGGTSFESALEFEGIDYTEPNRGLSDRFENAGSNYLLNGVGSLEIIPGGGDATRGNTGTGLISLTAKRGTYPSFGNLDYETGILGNAHQFGFEYGFATLKGSLSNYFDFIAEDRGFQYGPYGVSASGVIADPSSINPDLQALSTASQRAFYTTSVFNIANQSSRDFLDNAIFKFGKNNQQQVQLFVQAQSLHQDLDYGGAQILTAVPQSLTNGSNFITFNGLKPLLSLTSISNSTSLNKLYGSIATDTTTDPRIQAFVNQFAPRIVGGVPGTSLNSPETIDSPFSAYKIEYDNNLNSSTFLGARYYRTDDAASETLPSQGLFVPQEGGIRRGVSFDVTKIFGERHTLRVGGKYEYAVPFGERDNSVDYTGVFDGVYATNDNIPGSNTPVLTSQSHDILADFVKPSLSTGSGVGTPGCIGYGPISTVQPQEQCGYLYKFFPNGPPRLPAEVETPLARQQSYGLYAQDTYSPSGKFHILGGLRLDGYNFQLPGDPGDPPAVDGIRHQRLYEPKVGASYRLGARDAVRANFGRSLAIPLPTFLGNSIGRASLAAFAAIPSHDNITGKTAAYCGLPKLVNLGVQTGTIFIGNQPCTSYADQLYWLLRDARFAAQGQVTSPLRGASFTNYDFTYSHEFNNGFAVKATPFYRRGYDVVETSQTLFGFDPTTGTQELSPEIQSNLGSQSVTGLEFEITTPQRPTGLSATVTATYANQFGNDPPGDYLPTASLQLGEVYHSPNLAPLQGTIAATYRTKWGLRINPILTFKSGYPYGAGVYQALTVNGQPLYIPYTDAVYQGYYSGILANAQVNPQNPGTLTNPNIFATRGTEARTSGPGSLYSPQYINVDLTASLTPPRSSLTYGVSITNLFNRTSSVPYPNFSRDCQTVYSGLCASVGIPSVSDAFHSTPQLANGSGSAYQVFLNQTPIAIRAYIQAGL